MGGARYGLACALALAGCAERGATPPSRLGAPARADLDRLAEAAILDSENQKALERLSAIDGKEREIERLLARTGARRAISEEIYFRPAQVRIDPTGEQAINRVALALSRSPDLRVDIVGNTDSIPIRVPYDDNWQLSAERAHEVAVALITRGVDQHRIRIVGRADTDPVAPNDDEDGRAKNRRVDLYVVGGGYAAR